jgi:hypothetical protein
VTQALRNQNNMKTVRNLRDLERLGPCPEGVAFARKFHTLAEAWDACDRADWMMCVLVHANMLKKPTALQLATAFAARSPSQVCSLWVSRAASAASDADAAGDAWAASDASAFRIAYARNIDFDEAAYASEMRWQAQIIRQIVGNPSRKGDPHEMD